MSFNFSRVAFLVACCAALSSRPALAAPVWSDPLTGAQIDTTHWTVNAPNAGVTVAPSSMGVLMSIAASAHGPNFAAMLSNRCALAGDFDVQVDYQLNLWPAHSGVRLGLGAGSAAIERDSLSTTDVMVTTPGSEVYLADFASMSPFPDILTSDMQGTIRLTRSGAMTTAYYANVGGGWGTLYSAVTTSAPVSVDLQNWSEDFAFDTQSGGASVYFRNFAVNAGQLNCPDAGAPDAAGTPDASPRDAAADLGGGNVDGGGKTSSSGCSCTFGSDNTPATGVGLLSLVVLMLLALGLRRNPRAGT